MKVKDIMTTDLVTCAWDTSVKEAAKVMVKHQVGALLVVNDNSQTVGMLTESDFIGKTVSVSHAVVSIPQLFGETLYDASLDDIISAAGNRQVSEVMTVHLASVSPEADLTVAIKKLIDTGYRRLPVMENEKLVGLLARKDILRAFATWDESQQSPVNIVKEEPVTMTEH